MPFSHVINKKVLIRFFITLSFQNPCVFHTCNTSQFISTSCFKCLIATCRPLMTILDSMALGDSRDLRWKEWGLWVTTSKATSKVLSVNYYTSKTKLLRKTTRILRLLITISLSYSYYMKGNALWYFQILLPLYQWYRQRALYKSRGDKISVDWGNPGWLHKGKWYWKEEKLK